MENAYSSGRSFLEPAEYPGESIPLHVTCERCQRFAEECSKLMESPAFRSGQDSIPFELCTFEELYERAKSCHFCQLLSRHYREPLDHENTVLFPLNFSYGYICLGDNYDICIQVCANLQDLPYFLKLKNVPLQSGQNIPVMLSWLQECVKSHKDCKAFRRTVADAYYCPTRLLDVTDGQIRLTLTDEIPTGHISEPVQYLTLSHMWGSNPARQVRLTERRFHEFQQGISEGSMPYIYQEAIRITRALGFRYLWIDSLCIIQDLASDWQHEASKMAATYGNAICNLSYLFPPEDAQPRQREDDPRSTAPCMLSPPDGTFTGFYAEIRYKLAFDWLEQDHWPLLDRAWVMQEQLLCPCTIYLGHKNLIWECLEQYQDELVGPVVAWPADVSVTKRHLIRKAPHIPIVGSGAFLHTKKDWNTLKYFLRGWEDLCKKYVARRLTKEDDRVMAFAGIADAMQKIHNLTYLAGLWKEYLQPNLLWYVKRRASPNVFKSPTSEIPSWSWFSIMETQEHGTRPEWHITKGRTGPLRWTETEYNESWIWTELVFFQWGSSPPGHLPSKHLYQFKGAFICLKAFTVSATLRLDPRDIDHDPADVVLEFAGHSLPFYPDDPRWFDGIPEQTVKLAIIGKKLNESKQYYEYHRGLALLPDRKVEGKNTWQRVGMWELWGWTSDRRPLQLKVETSCIEEMLVIS